MADGGLLWPFFLLGVAKYSNACCGFAACTFDARLIEHLLARDTAGQQLTAYTYLYTYICICISIYDSLKCASSQPQDWRLIALKWIYFYAIPLKIKDSLSELSKIKWQSQWSFHTHAHIQNIFSCLYTFILYIKAFNFSSLMMSRQISSRSKLLQKYMYYKSRLLD